MRERTYGEIAYEAYRRLRGEDFLMRPWDEHEHDFQDIWDNIAAIVLASYHQRQMALSKQTTPKPTAIPPSPLDK